MLRFFATSLVLFFILPPGMAAGPLDGIDCLRQYPGVLVMEAGGSPDETAEQRARQAERRIATRLGLTPERVGALLKPCAEHLLATPSSPALDRARALFYLGRHQEARQMALEAGDTAHRAANRQPMEVVAALQLAAYAALELGAGEDAVKYISVASGEAPPGRELGLWSQLQAVSARAYELLKMPRDQEQTLRNILSEHERRLGEAHADTVRVRSELAAVLYLHGRDEDAERQSRLVLRDTLRLKGTGAAESQVARRNLARVLEGMGRHAEAEPLRREVLESQRENAAGATEGSQLAAMEQLVKNLLAQGRHHVAEPLALELAEDGALLNGKDAAGTLEARLLHARCVAEQSRTAEAAALLESLRHDSRRAFGAEHRTTLAVAHLLGCQWNRLERHAQAQEVLVETLAARRRVLSADDLDTLETRHQLGVALLAQGQVKEALAEIRIALMSFSRLLKPQDPRLKAAQASADKLAATEAGKDLLIQEQRDIYQQAARANEGDPAARLNAHLALVVFIEAVGRIENALAEYAALLASCEKELGPGADGTLLVAGKMAVAEMKAGRMQGAADRLRGLLASREKRLAPGTLALEEVRFHLGYALNQLGSLEEAEKHVLKSYEACKDQAAVNAAFKETMRLTLNEIRGKRQQRRGPGIGSLIAPTPGTALPEVGTLNRPPSGL